jgi:hypothetical protein
LRDAPGPGQLARAPGVLPGVLEAGLGLRQALLGLADVLDPGPVEEEPELGIRQGNAGLGPPELEVQGRVVDHGQGVALAHGAPLLDV